MENSPINLNTQLQILNIRIKMYSGGVLHFNPNI